MTSAFSWQNSISLCPASFCIPRPNLPVTPGVSWLPIEQIKDKKLVWGQWLCVDLSYLVGQPARLPESHRTQDSKPGNSKGCWLLRVGHRGVVREKMVWTALPRRWGRMGRQFWGVESGFFQSSPAFTVDFNLLLCFGIYAGSFCLILIQDPKISCPPINTSLLFSENFPKGFLWVPASTFHISLIPQSKDLYLASIPSLALSELPFWHLFYRGSPKSLTLPSTPSSLECSISQHPGNLAPWTCLLLCPLHWTLSRVRLGRHLLCSVSTSLAVFSSPWTPLWEEINEYLCSCRWETWFLLSEMW